VRSKNIIGPKIRAARDNARISQAKLAARLQIMGIKIDRSAIAKIETGRRPVSDIEIAAIADILTIQLPWLFAESRTWFQQQVEVD
jgi:transcriptional regulator with XRE-family HTH domain